MSNSLNKVTLIGNLGQDPAVKMRENGEKIARLSLATTETWKDKDTSEKKSRTEWHNITVFNHNLALIIEKYLGKGSRLFIEGSLTTRRWTDENKNIRSISEIVVSRFAGSMIILDSRKNSEATNVQQESKKKEWMEYANDVKKNIAVEDDSDDMDYIKEW